MYALKILQPFFKDANHEDGKINKFPQNLELIKEKG